MTKAEQRALERFPEEMTPLVYQEQIDLFGGKTEVDFNLLPRSFFQLGYEQAEKDLGWISVKDRLPEVGHYVFTCCDNQGTPQSVAVGFYDSDGSWFDDLDGRIDVDYWMEIPKFNDNGNK